MPAIEPNLSKLTEPELLARLAENSSASFGELASRYRCRLVRHLASRSLPPADAEDLAQETLARAYARIATYDIGRPFAPWLLAIASRLVANHWRAGARQVTSDDLDLPAPADNDPARQAATACLRENLWTQVRDTLSPKQYQAVWLRYAGERSTKQVAQAMRISTIHVKVLLHRARKKLLEAPGLVRLFELDRSGKQPPQGGAS